MDERRLSRKAMREDFSKERENTGRKEKYVEALQKVRSFEEYEIRETESGKYELIKASIVASMFSEDTC